MSLGETRAAAPLVERLLRERAGGDAILLTHMTATGREAGRALFGDRVVQAWLPYDVPFAMQRFLAHFRPRAGLLDGNGAVAEPRRRCCRAAASPLLLVNARLSERSARRLRARRRRCRGRCSRSLAGVAAQIGRTTPRDCATLGARDVVVTGNLKFDVAMSAATLARGRRAARERSARRGRCWIAASTRDGEEALLLDALARAARCPPATLIVIVPRHPQRFDAVAALLRRPRRAVSRGAARTRRSPPSARVVLGDSLGEMLAYYAAADVAFVGGSLLPLGGQNLIEPIAVGRADARRSAHVQFRRGERTRPIAAGAAVRVRDADDAVRDGGALLRAMPASATRDARARADVHAPRIAAPSTGCGRGSRRRLAAADETSRAVSPRRRRLIVLEVLLVSVPIAALSRSTPIR